MAFSNFMTGSYLAWVLVFIFFLTVYIGQRSQNKRLDDFKNVFQRRSSTVLFVGSIIFSSSLVWCGASVALGLSSVGIVLGPVLIFGAVGWVLIVISSSWVQQHNLLVAFIGTFGFVFAILWIVVLVAYLSPANPRNFDLVFFPAIGMGVIGMYVLITPVICWYLRAMGTISNIK
jgi:hypothetical protein